MNSTPRVLLISMPWHAPERPSLGLSLLQAEVRALGAECEIAYLGFTFADYIGLEDYLWVHSQLPYTAFAGDWTFTPSLYGDRPGFDARYVHNVLLGAWQLKQADVQRLLRVRSYIQPYFEHCVTAFDFGEYDIVGFTSTFEQNIASLAFARRIKGAYPNVTIAFGGANWEGEMGLALHERFDFVDIVCSGEADESFPATVERIATGRNLQEVPGLVIRQAGKSVSTGHPRMIAELDGLPMPDYDDYFAHKEACASAAEVTPLLLLETSRGCWWGAKHHCTFCGLNGSTMTFRSKSAERVIDEIRYLTGRHGAHAISVVDNILDMRYFKTLLPKLIEEEMPMNLFYEVKANLSLEQVRMLSAAGIRHVQPGIESLGDRVLDLMRKGTSALQNIQLLKWCKEFGIRPEWNFLYGFPGEDGDDYRAMIPLIDAIDFLDPPSGHGPIRLDRFSPYHATPGDFGMTNVRAMLPYEYLYPFDPPILARVAYYFDFDYADGRGALTYAAPTVGRIRDWIASGPVGSLWVVGLARDRVAIVDQRPGGRTIAFEGWQAHAYVQCDRVSTLSSLRRALPDVPAEDVRRFLDDCIARRLMVRTKDRYLSLAVHRPPRRGLGQTAEQTRVVVGAP